MFLIRESSQRRASYHFQQNVVKSDLAFKKKEEVDLKVKAISLLASGKKIEVLVEDNPGKLDVQEQTQYFLGVTDKTTLEKLAKLKFDRLRYDGFRGHFEGFGIPYDEHNDIVDLYNDWYPEFKGSYYIDKVVKKFGKEGFRRIIELGSTAPGL